MQYWYIFTKRRKNHLYKDNLLLKINNSFERITALKKKRTDLAAEFAADLDENEVKLSETFFEGIKATEVTLGRQGGKLIGKPKGKYITLHCENEDKVRCGCALAHFVTELLQPSMPWEKVMVAGLGNERVTPDSLGARTVRKIPATAHLSSTPEFKELGLRPVVVIETGVMGQTGLESADCLNFVARNILPAAVIAIDSLACSDFSRLGNTIQITDSGIAPGSGVGGNRRPLNKEIMGSKVIAIGVPTVIDLDDPSESVKSPMMVTPRDIDNIMERYSEIISMGVNSALNPTLSREETELLRF